MSASIQQAAPSETVVRAACPHDCPDTCAMLVTVREQDGKKVAVKVAAIDASHHHRHLCTKVVALSGAHLSPGPCVASAEGVGAKGEASRSRVVDKRCAILRSA